MERRSHQCFGMKCSTQPSMTTYVQRWTHENWVHHFLENKWGISKSKAWDLRMIKPKWSSECCLSGYSFAKKWWYYCVKYKEGNTLALANWLNKPLMQGYGWWSSIVLLIECTIIATICSSPSFSWDIIWKTHKAMSGA